MKHRNQNKTHKHTYDHDVHANALDLGHTHLDKLK